MRFIPSLFTTTCFCLVTAAVCLGQDIKPVSWSTQWNYLSGSEGSLVVTASLAPGWHLYSQYLDEGGPIPTHLDFIRTNDFEIMGKTQEKGSPLIYYDSLYEMNITQYSYEVGFLQKIRLNKRIATIRCEVLFMACSENQCIPMREELSIPVAIRRSP